MHRSRLAIVTWCCSLVLLASCTSHVAAPARLTVEEQVRWLTPGLAPEFESATPDAPSPYLLHPFTYGRAPGWPYGRGFAVANSTSGAVLWVYLRHGDYPPHRVRWGDFDGDGRQDIFFHTGEEDEFSTTVLLNRVVADRFGISHFVSGYENDHVYGIVVDFGDDGRPELIIPEEYADASDECANEFREFERNDSEARETYIHLSGSFRDFNFTFGDSNTEVAGLALFDQIQVITFGTSSASEPLQRHLRWRIVKLLYARESITPICRDRVDRTVSHLEWLLHR